MHRWLNRLSKGAGFKDRYLNVDLSELHEAERPTTLHAKCPHCDTPFLIAPPPLKEKEVSLRRCPNVRMKCGKQFYMVSSRRSPHRMIIVRLCECVNNPVPGYTPEDKPCPICYGSAERLMT